MRKLRIWSHLLTKSLMENFFFACLCILIMSRTSFKHGLKWIKHGLIIRIAIMILQNISKLPNV